MKKVLLTWANGMLAHDFLKYCNNDFEIIGMDKEQMDITSLEQVHNVIQQVQPDIILNCAAYTNVDEAENTDKLINFQVNALGVYHLAKVAKEEECDLITISTDYVFDGALCRHSERSEESSSIQGYLPTDPCNPINAYGMAKYLGEQLVKSELPSAIIVRTSRLYGGWPAFKNFPNTMLKLAETKNELQIINDQFGLPTFTKDLALALKIVIEQIEQRRGNIFHFSNSWEKTISWFDFAQEIFKLKEKKIRLSPCSSSEFPTRATRPQFSGLANESGIQLRDWKEGLKEYLENLFTFLSYYHGKTYS